MLQIILWILKLIDGLLSILDISNGLSDFSYDFNSVNVLEFFINNSVIENLFWNIFLFTIALTCFFCIFGIIKVMVKNSNTILNVLSKFAIAIIAVLIVLSLIIICISLTSKIISLLKDVFNVEIRFNLSKIIFNNSVEEWYNNHSINTIDLKNISVKELLGEYEKDVIFPSKWLHNGIINPETFYYLPCLITTIISLISLGIVAIRLIKRVYDIVLLYLTMPVSISSIPLDDGASFKNWLEIFTNKVVIIYSSVLVINLFYFIYPIINEFNLSIEEEYQKLLKLLFASASVLSIANGQIIFNKIFKFKENKNNLNIKSEKNDTEKNTIYYLEESHQFIEGNRKRKGY